MKLFCIAITASALTFTAACQSKLDLASSNSNVPAITGSDVVAELSKSVNVKKVKLGDPVKATVTQDLLAQGKIIIRRGSKLVGHVTEAKVRSKEDEESRLGVVFDKALLKGGGEIDFTAAVRALAPGVRVGAVDKPDPMGAPPRGPFIGQSTTPQPMTNSSGISSGGGKISPDLSTTASPSVSSKDTVTTNPASRAAIYSAAAGQHGSSETDLMGAGSRGVFGLPDLKLHHEPGGGAGSVITSTHHNVKLDSGTQMVLQVSSLHEQ